LGPQRLGVDVGGAPEVARSHVQSRHDTGATTLVSDLEPVVRQARLYQLRAEGRPRASAKHSLDSSRNNRHARSITRWVVPFLGVGVAAALITSGATARAAGATPPTLTLLSGDGAFDFGSSRDSQSRAFQFAIQPQLPSGERIRVPA